MHSHPLPLLLLAAAITAPGAAEGLVMPPPGASPFAGRQADSYSSFTADDGKPGVLIWGEAPVDHFGSRTVVMDRSGARAIRQVPAAGVHPRILFTPADLPDLRKRLQETRCGQEAWKNLLSWTEMLKGTYDEHADYAKPDRWNGGFGGLHGRVPLFRLGMTRPYHRNPSRVYDDLAAGTATAFPEYAWNVFALEAFRCLIEDDQAGGRKLAKVVTTALAIAQAERAAAQATKPSTRPPAEPIGRFQLAFTYDFIHHWLDATQRTAIHDELAATTWSHDNYGTFNEATTSRSNWATFSYWLFEALAIEGEPGFNDLKVRGMYRGWRNLLTYGWFQSGATFEGEAKSQLGMDGVIPFAMRAQAYGFDNLVGHPYLRAYASSFLPHSVLPTRDGFIKYDLLGGSRTRAGGAACDLLGLKYLLPDDPVVDWVYRKTVGEQYEHVPDRPDGYYNGLLFFAIFASDFTPANDDPARLGLGNTFQCGERALMMTRSDWASPDATMVCLHTRQANGGHPFADRNGLMLAGAGRVWSPNGYASFSTTENSVVGIDGKNQGEWVAGRMVEIQDRPLATFAVGDAAYAWNWNWQYLAKKRGYYTVEDVRAGRVAVPAGWQLEANSVNDLALTRLPFPYLSTPMSEKPHWIQPAGAISPLARQANYPVLKAFRSAGLVRGAHPYVLVVDDIQKDQAVHRYDWTLALEHDLQIARIDRSRAGQVDLLLTGDDPTQQRARGKEALPPMLGDDAVIPAGRPMLLVRVLHYDTTTTGAEAEPTIVELPNAKEPKKYGPVRRLVIPATSVAPRFKVLLYPHRQGTALPATTWNDDHTAVTVAWPQQQDVVAFSPGTSGVTHIAVTRAGAQLITLTGEARELE